MTICDRTGKRAHPRSRGENNRRTAKRVDDLGSSPLTRGKQAPGHDHHRIAGLIPAHAGKTVDSHRCLSFCWAHPRSRGENNQPQPGPKNHPGSSPLTRGKRPSGAQGLVEGGLIPAHAGKTTNLSPVQKTTPAHPRSRGENGHPERRVLWKVGSSPLTRGKPERPVRPIPQRRLIPAHAGKTEPICVLRGIGAAHPRSRGENVTRPREASVVCGSSPLTRGKRLRGLEGRLGDRLIPAHAGKTP